MTLLLNVEMKETLKEMKNLALAVSPDREVNYDNLLQVLTTQNPNLDLEQVSDYYKRILVLHLIHHYLSIHIQNLMDALDNDTVIHKLEEIEKKTKDFCLVNEKFKSYYKEYLEIFYKDQNHFCAYLLNELDELTLIIVQ